MSKHGPTDEHQNQAPDGGIAGPPKGAAAAQQAFEEALRRGDSPETLNSPDPREDTGASQVPA